MPHRHAIAFSTVRVTHFRAQPPRRRRAARKHRVPLTKSRTQRPPVSVAAAHAGFIDALWACLKLNPNIFFVHNGCLKFNGRLVKFIIHRSLERPPQWLHAPGNSRERLLWPGTCPLRLRRRGASLASTDGPVSPPERIWTVWGHD